MGILHIDHIDDDLHRKARSLASLRGESLKALVTRAIEREVERLEAEKRGGGR